MRRTPSTLAVLLVAVALVGCGSERSPLGPTPTPSPAPATFSGSVTDTVTGAPVAGFTALVSGSRLTVSAPGYVTRETRAGASSVDIIPEASFDLEFYRQFARGTLEDPMQPLRVLAQAPSLYLQTAGLSTATISALEQAARGVVPAMTGGRFTVTAWETGTNLRSDAYGWIVIELVNDPTANCGRSNVGAVAGHVWLNRADRCSFDQYSPTALAHEIGHALGFFHVASPDALMFAHPAFGRIAPSDIERRHAAIAYHRQAGNRDIDVDR
jgi:hypothetical protein